MRVTIFADASYCQHDKVAGYGYWIAAERGRRAGGGRCKVMPVTTSVVAEMMALVNALHDAMVYGLVMPDDEVLFTTDCQPALDAFLGVRYNLNDQESAVVRKMSELSTKGRLKLRYRHVKGHTGKSDNRSLCNDHCDTRAKKGLKAARNAKHIADAKQLILNGESNGTQQPAFRQLHAAEFQHDPGDVRPDGVPAADRSRPWRTSTGSRTER